MTSNWVGIGICSAVFILSGAAKAADVDFTRFLASSSGAAGVAAAVAGLGHCDTPLSWEYAHDENLGKVNPDHLLVACQYKDPDDEEFYDKSVTARFMFWDGDPVLDSLNYLP
ncbi:hypothetical protein [Roseibium sp.]|uniref:hypothetical protein n=1 Tax=Roseibium sp. TaxID=1936156 RepID=UPI0032644E37